DIKANQERLGRLLNGLNIAAELLEAKRDGTLVKLVANTAVLRPPDILGFLADYKWLRDEPMRLEIDFLRGTDRRDPQIEDWLLLAPQVKDATNKYIELNDKQFYIVYRSREENAPNTPNNRFNTYNDPRHRWFAELIAGITVDVPLTDPNEALRRLR